jgi:hypothetical protein
VLGSGVEFCQADRASSVPLLIGTLSIDFLQFVRVVVVREADFHVSSKGMDDRQADLPKSTPN